MPEKINTKCCRTFLEHENARLRRENAQLKEENNTLKERFNDCSYTVSDLKTKLENIENEKRSLLMAIKLLHDDNNSTSANNRQSTCSTWEVPKPKVHSKPSTREISVNHGQNKTIPPTEMKDKPRETIRTYNRYDLLSQTKEDDEEVYTIDENSSNKSNTPPVIKRNCPGAISRGHNKQQKGNQPTKSCKTGDKSGINGKLAFIAGDSILQHVHGWELSNAEQRVSVKSFSGSKAEDMGDYLKPLMRKKPDTMILHIGTNDIKDDTKSAEVVAAGILNLGSEIKNNLPHTKLCISGITVRKDKASIQNKIKNVNDILMRVCGQNKWTFIDNSNIDYTCLNRRGLHLNRKGRSIISKNFSNYLNHHN